MRLTDMVEKIKHFMVSHQDLPRDVFLVALVVLSAIGGFLIGRIAERSTPSTGEQPLRIVSQTAATALYNQSAEQKDLVQHTQRDAQTPTVETEQGRMYVASKNGTAFYLPSCSGAKRIKEENKIYFSSKTEALGMGYKPASTCKGI